jgi:hypothetical protein
MPETSPRLVGQAFQPDRTQRSASIMPETSPLDHETIKVGEPFPIGPVESLPAADEMPILNDDVMIDVAPHRPSGTIRVKLVYAGRSTPTPTDDPWAQ